MLRSLLTSIAGHRDVEQEGERGRFLIGGGGRRRGWGRGGCCCCCSSSEG